MAKLTREVHIVDELKAKMLLGMDILVPEGALFNITDECPRRIRKSTRNPGRQAFTTSGNSSCQNGLTSSLCPNRLTLAKRPNRLSSSSRPERLPPVRHPRNIYYLQPQLTLFRDGSRLPSRLAKQDRSFTLSEFNFQIICRAGKNHSKARCSYPNAP